MLMMWVFSTEEFSLPFDSGLDLCYYVYLDGDFEVFSLVERC